MPDTMLESAGIAVVRDEVIRVDKEVKQVICSQGQSFSYDKLFLATGSRPFVPALEGADLEGVLTLRGLPDAARIKNYLAEHGGRNIVFVGAGFISMAVVTAMAGWILMEAAKGIADQTGLSETLVGGLFTALATSTPELVTTIAAIRIGALTLAVSNIFGTNCFNMLVVAAADVGYAQGSIYHDIAPVQMTWGVVSILMTAILLLGLVRRETYGIGRIGFESALILIVYAVALGVIVTST